MKRSEFIHTSSLATLGLSVASVKEPTRSLSGRMLGKVVLITGATSGIGEAAAFAFAHEGANVYFCGRREALGRQVEARIRQAGGEATYQRADVRDEDQVRALVQGCIGRYGRLDVAFNNAGIETPNALPIAELATEEFLDVMTTNATGVFLSMKYELPHLLRNVGTGANQTKGIIINTASVSGHVGFANIAPYSASKHAIIGLTQCAALEYGPLGIRINSISPGGVDTPMLRRVYAKRGFRPEQILPSPNLLHHANSVGEMASILLFLATEEASSLLGTDIDVTSGMLTGAYAAPAPPARSTPSTPK